MLHMAAHVPCYQPPPCACFVTSHYSSVKQGPFQHPLASCSAPRAPLLQPHCTVCTLYWKKSSHCLIFHTELVSYLAASPCPPGRTHKAVPVGVTRVTGRPAAGSRSEHEEQHDRDSNTSFLTMYVAFCAITWRRIEPDEQDTAA
jgi:hypothetical protein